MILKNTPFLLFFLQRESFIGAASILIGRQKMRQSQTFWPKKLHIEKKKYRENIKKIVIFQILKSTYY